MIDFSGKAVLFLYGLAVTLVVSCISEWIAKPLIGPWTTMFVGIVTAQSSLLVITGTRYQLSSLAIALVGLTFFFAGVRMMQWHDPYTPVIVHLLGCLMYAMILWIAIRQEQKSQQLNAAE